MSQPFVNTSPKPSSITGLTTYTLSTNTSNVNTTGETSPLQPLPRIGLFIALFTAVFIGNCILIAILVYKKQKHKWRIFYRLVFIVAMSDLIGQVITTPMSLASYSNKDILVTGGHFCDVYSFIMIMSSLMSVLLVCLMSLDRFIAIRSPLFYRTRKTIGKMYIAVGCVIVVSLCVGLLPTFGVNRHKLQNEGVWCFFDLYPAELAGRVYLCLCAVIGMAAVLSMLILNGLVLHLLWHRYKGKTRPGNPMQIPNDGLGVKSIQNILYLVILMAVFFFSWTPFIVRLFINAAGSSAIDYELDAEIIKLASMHQILNPWIYILHECLVPRCLKHAKKHCKHGSIIRRVLDAPNQQQETVSFR